ncbi:MAG: hypothetical protein QF654_14495 [Alphaproteobacteria bacterium]|jgi:hypothetical protein|nr:hypothetical protein [Alphaproteobacteria bacterium]
MSGDLIPEIREDQATGEIAHIYGEIRRDFAVPAVSTVYRHVATVPGCLEWVWATLRPAVECGDFQEAAQGLAQVIAVAPLAPLSPDALRNMGVDAAAEQAIRDVYTGYNRNNPLNILFAFALKRLLVDGAGGGPYLPDRDGWTPPAPLADLIPMVDPEDMGPAHRALAAEIGSWGFPPDRRWIPGVYRHLAHWPDYLVEACEALRPRLEAGDFAHAGETMIAGADAAASSLVDRLPAAGAEFNPPRAAEAEALAAFLDSLIPKIPEMIVICALLAGALPSDEQA